MNFRGIVDDVTLLPGLFHERSELARKYATELSGDGLLQNFELEAGLRYAVYFPVCQRAGTEKKCDC
jgi:hypothetical protein